MFKIINALTGSRTNTYRLHAKISGAEAPTNSLAFNVNASLLAAGGDDETLRIWQVPSGKISQILLDQLGRWGQITCLSFIYPDAAPMANEYILAGTGRGMIVVFRRKRNAIQFDQILNNQVFKSGNSVESFDFDANHQRLVVSSHYGDVKMYGFEPAGGLNILWEREFPDTIPRSIKFTERGTTVLVFGLEAGSVVYLDAETANDTRKRELNTSIGGVDICPTTGNLLVDNLGTGFDIHPATSRGISTALTSFAVSSSKRFIKQGVFAEQGRVAACGSDHGRVYVFNVAAKDVVQSLTHAKSDVMIQTVEAAIGVDAHWIASGSSGGNFDICLWRKGMSEGKRSSSKKRVIPDTLTILNIMILIILCWITTDSWSPRLIQHANKMTTVVRDSLSSKSGGGLLRLQNHNSEEIDLGRILEKIDDETLRKLLRIPPVTVANEEVGESLSVAEKRDMKVPEGARIVDRLGSGVPSVSKELIMLSD